MVRLNRILISGGVVMFAVVAALFYFRTPSRTEPVYQGKSLTQWLKQLDDDEILGISTRERDPLSPAQLQAAEAIRTMGTNALPLLMEDIHAHPDEQNGRIKFWRGVNHGIQRLTGSYFGIDPVTPEDQSRWRAAQGLAALGPLAKPAVPELKRLLFTNYFRSSIKEAAYVLATVGPEGVDILTNAAQPQSEWSGMCAIWALGRHPAAGTNVIPFLLNATSSASEGTACGAIQVLGLFHVQGERVIPVLTNLLTSTNAAVSRSAAGALAQFGTNAVSALPLLQTLTNNPTTREWALEPLEKIQAALPR